MTKRIATAGLALTVLAMAAGPALAGPVGSGLGLTEEVARKVQAERKLAAALAAQAAPTTPAR